MHFIWINIYIFSMTMATNFFFKIDKICQCLPPNCSKTPSWIFKTYPFRNSKIFWTIKCVLWSGTCPLREINVPWNNLIHSELRIFTEVSFKPFFEPTHNQGAYVKTQCSYSTEISSAYKFSKHGYSKKKVKSYKARSHAEENQLPLFVRSIINYLQ